MTTPYLSVVMPCLNAGATIERSLASIRAQGCPDVEIVVADGGSSDGTAALVGMAPDISFVSEPDTGLSDAFNKGAARAQGEVLGWLNGDDIYLPGVLSAVQAVFRRDPALLWLTGQCLIVDENGQEIRKGVTRYKNALLSRYSHPLHLSHNFVSAPATFFRRTAFEEVGGMDVGLRYSMDYDLYLRLGRRGRPVVLDRPLAAFTMAPGTLSMSGFETQFVEHRDVARRYRQDAPAAVLVNAGLSKAITFAYTGMRWMRENRSGSTR